MDAQGDEKRDPLPRYSIRKFTTQHSGFQKWVSRQFRKTGLPTRIIPRMVWTTFSPRRHEKGCLPGPKTAYASPPDTFIFVPPTLGVRLVSALEHVQPDCPIQIRGFARFPSQFRPKLVSTHLTSWSTLSCL